MFLVLCQQRLLRIYSAFVFTWELLKTYFHFLCRKASNLVVCIEQQLKAVLKDTCTIDSIYQLISMYQTQIIGVSNQPNIQDCKFTAVTNIIFCLWKNQLLPLSLDSFNKKYSWLKKKMFWIAENCSRKMKKTHIKIILVPDYMSYKYTREW